MEKLSEEVKLFEDIVNFMEKISVSNERLTSDDRKVLSMARDKVNGYQRELCAVISSSSAIDVSLIVRDYRSKIEKELNNICNKSYKTFFQERNASQKSDEFEKNDMIIP
ncbi:14-3-3-like protein [Artemisia annua]|uniref:14-3-3-like protein n=1 Tax=Artemisia annua TaxID=35608 RepID=A0A2U1LPD2_ARTAN|nr:14-3-3-like protein [Artemisia annua]